MKLIATILLAMTCWLITSPAQADNITSYEQSYVEISQAPHYEISLPEVVFFDFETLFHPSIVPQIVGWVGKSIQAFTSAEQQSVHSTLPRLHLKLRVFRN